MLNDSYRLSIEAKYFFETGDYKKAETLAKKAYILDPYNRMAFTIYTQSKIAKQWQNYINDSIKYFKKIEQIANKNKITQKDKEKIKIMLEIIIDEYNTLTPSNLLPENLKQKGKELYRKGKKLYVEVFGKRGS
jgi:tetratricopeptide (TPR) repeat protein